MKKYKLKTIKQMVEEIHVREAIPHQAPNEDQIIKMRRLRDIPIEQKRKFVKEWLLSAIMKQIEKDER